MAAAFNKWFLILLLSVICTSFVQPKKFHPFFISVTQIEHNKKEKALEISCKIFTDDFEKALRQNYKTNVDLLHAPDKNGLNKLISGYIIKHLQINANGKPLQLEFVGFENDNEAIWNYFEVKNVGDIKKIEITNDLLLEYKSEQVNILHVIVNSNRKSKKLDYSDSKASFTF